jgi:hypothetical protein
MTLPVSPNAISLSQVSVELLYMGPPQNPMISLNDAQVRALFGKSSGAISLSDGWGKSTSLVKPVVTVTNGNGFMYFDWPANAGVTFWYSLAGASVVSTTNNYLQITGLGSNVSKTFTVYAAKSGMTNSATSTSVTGTTHTLYAGPSFSSAIITTSTIAFRWSNVSGASGYQVSTDNATWGDPNGTLAHTLSSLNSNQTYTLYVRSLNAYSDAGASTTNSQNTTYSLPVVTATLHTTDITYTWPADIAGNTAQYSHNNSTWTNVSSSLTYVRDTSAATSYTTYFRWVNGLNVTTVVTSGPNTTHSVIAGPVFTTPTISNNGIIFTWTSVVGASSYQVSTDNASWVSTNNGLASHNLTGLNMNQTYQLYVRALNADNVAGGSTYDARTTTFTAPTITVAVDSSSQITYTWTNPTNNSPQYSTDNSNWITPVGSTTSWQRTGLSASSPYTSYFRWQNGLNMTSSVASGPVNTTDLPQLATPSFTVATGGVNQLSFTWGAVANATSYDVTFNGVTTNQSSVSFARTSGVILGTYTLTVVAKASGYTNSNAGVSSSVTVTDPIVMNSIVVNAPATSGTLPANSSIHYYSFATVTAITYTFTLNSAVFDTWVELYEDGNPTELKHDDDTGEGSNSLMTYDCVANTAYIIRVRSFNFGGSGAYTLALTATLPVLGTPVYSIASGGINAVSFEWSSISGATSYDVTFNGSTSNQAGTTFSRTSVAAGTYNLTVVAKAVGYTNSSNGVSSNVIATAVVTPSNPTFGFSNVTSSGFRITLSSTNALNYYLYEYSSYLSLGSNQTGIFDVDYGSGHASESHSYRAFAQSSDGTTSGWSDVASQSTGALIANESLSISISSINSTGATVALTYAGTHSISTYNVYLYLTIGGSGASLGTTSSNNTSSQTITGLSPSTKYYVVYSVFYVGGAGFSIAANEADSFTTAAEVLPTPITISPTHRQIMRVTGSTMPTWYSFTPINTGYYTFTLSSIIDPLIQIWNSTGTLLIGEDNDSGAGNNSQKDLSLTAGIEYRIKVSAYWSANTSSHELAIYGGRCTMYLDPTTIQGVISLASEQVTYLFVPRSNQSCTVTMKGDIADTYLMMSDYTGTILNAPSTDDDAGDGAWAQFTYSFVANNYYYISCMAYYSTTTGNFTLTIT